jgi:dipeptidyl aminopeptidase/acylaminoacyl peptidase
MRKPSFTVITVIAAIVIAISGAAWSRYSDRFPLPWANTLTDTVTEVITDVDLDAVPAEETLGGLVNQSHPLSIEFMRQQEYPGSEIVVEQTLSAGSNYSRSIVSYRSEGLKQFALFTVPDREPPENGWPAIVFNHGYIPPAQYQTASRYVAYVDAFARRGFVVLAPDYRGHGNSEGEASGGYGSPAYTIDVLNGLASLRQHPAVDEQNIGMWGHSMGGHITLRAMVVDPNIKAGVIWAGVVGTYEELLNNWRRSGSTPPPLPSGARRWRQVLLDTYGSPEDNPTFWNSISPGVYVGEISGPVQIHHATGDDSVPVSFSESLQSRLEAAGKDSELFIYQGDDHNISGNFGLAMRRSVEFFEQHLKGE